MSITCMICTSSGGLGGTIESKRIGDLPKIRR